MNPNPSRHNMQLVTATINGLTYYPGDIKDMTFVTRKAKLFSCAYRYAAASYFDDSFGQGDATGTGWYGGQGAIVLAEI